MIISCFKNTEVETVVTSMSMDKLLYEFHCWVVDKPKILNWWTEKNCGYPGNLVHVGFDRKKNDQSSHCRQYLLWQIILTMKKKLRLLSNFFFRRSNYYLLTNFWVSRLGVIRFFVTFQKKIYKNEPKFIAFLLAVVVNNACFMNGFYTSLNLQYPSSRIKLWHD